MSLQPDREETRVVIGRVVNVLVLVAGLLVLGLVPGNGLPPASAASVVSDTHCRRLDPNLVHGACLRYRARSGTAYTWIGSYRAGNGRVFFCIDYLYDSRIGGRPTITSTHGLVNQLGDRIGAPEVAALNYLVSTWAGSGSTGSDVRDAAIALIIRELMSDGVRPDGTVVYPRGLKVGQRVRPPIGGLDGPIMTTAQQMWADASRYRGGYRLRLTASAQGPLELGTRRSYRVEVISADGFPVPRVPVSFTCAGPVVCPKPIRTGRTARSVAVAPTAVGELVLRASASGPASDGRIYRTGGWRTHGGVTAQDRGTQRGWIAGRSVTRAEVRATALIVKGTPEIVTRASQATATPAADLTDRVTVSGLPVGYRQQVTATLYGPYDAQPGPHDCTDAYRVGSVQFLLERNGEVVTPPVRVRAPGYYTWVEQVPGDDRTNAVTTPCGLVEETTLVTPRAPAVRTRASAQRARVGASVHDTVVVTGLGVGDLVTVRWRLLGPVAPRGASCDGLDWSDARVLDSGTFVVRADGTYRTRSTTLRVPGCITYAEDLPGTATTAPASSPPGLPLETVVVTRPPTPFVPEIPTGPVGTRR